MKSITFFFYRKLPHHLQLKLYWLAMRRKHYHLAWLLVDQMGLGDDMRHLLTLAEESNNTGVIK